MSSHYNWDDFWRKPERREQPPPNVTPIDPARLSRYAAQALRHELDNVAHAAEGQRNDTLNSSAFALAQLVAAGALDEYETFDALRAAALTSGLSTSETDKTLRSAFRAGKQQPRVLPTSTHVDAAPDAPPPTDEPPSEPPSDSVLDEFWTTRELLTHIQTYARARRASPWAVLGVVLARVVAATPPAVVLPPTIGGQASLNLFVGLVGTSGSGKGAAERVAAECFRLGTHITTVTTGSGEGIAHAYKRRRRNGELEDITDAVLFSVPEIDTLSALGSRQGATLMPELRRGWSGEALGFAYADPSKRLPVDAHSYRMCLVAGIQPARARALLDDADGGTPQRFIWVAATDRHAPDEPPDAPAPMTWQTPPSWSPMTHRDAFSEGRTVMGVCETARKTIDDARVARLRGDGDALDGHLLLSQLKTAAALALADSRLDVTDDDWALADVVVRQSTATRTSVAHTLTDAFRVKNRQRAEAEAERADITAIEMHEKATRRVTRTVLRKLQQASDDGIARNALRRAVAHRDRAVFDNVIDALLTTGQIEQRETESGVRYAAL